VQREQQDGVRLLRVWLATSPRRTLLNRLATFVTFTFCASWRLLREPHAAAWFAVLQPLSVAVTLPLLARVKGSRLVFNLQDLHPDAQIKLGLIRNALLIWALRGLERFAYRHCDVVTAISAAFRAHVVKHAGFDTATIASRTAVIGNWVDIERIHPDMLSGRRFREAQGLNAANFVVLWAGTIGHVAGAEIVVEAAQRLNSDPRIQFLVVGDGPQRATMEHRAAELELTNIRFLGFQPEADLLGVQNSADVSIVTLAPTLAEVSVPSKVLAYLAAGRPVVASVPSDSETASLLSRSGAGMVIDAGDADALAQAIRLLAADASLVQVMGEAGRHHAVTELSRQAAVQRYDALFRRLVDRV
jgi:colanic acid biosynthesis glycosyl transferase WcaI